MKATYFEKKIIFIHINNKKIYKYIISEREREKKNININKNNIKKEYTTNLYNKLSVALLN
jgi:hypothetical protein